MKNEANVRELRLNATVWGELLRDQIADNPRQIPVQRKDGSLALKISALEARVLAGMKMVAGLVRNGFLRYLVALVPKSVIIRVLRMDPPRPGEISRVASDGAHTFSQHIDARHAKLGRIGGFRTRHIGFQRVLDALPGDDRLIERRICA